MVMGQTRSRVEEGSRTRDRMKGSVPQCQPQRRKSSHCQPRVTRLPYMLPRGEIASQPSMRKVLCAPRCSGLVCMAEPWFRLHLCLVSGRSQGRQGCRQFAPCSLPILENSSACSKGIFVKVPQRTWFIRRAASSTEGESSNSVQEAGLCMGRTWTA